MHSVELRVRYAETDQMGVVYHAEYLVWCEVGRTEFIRSVGMPYAALEASGVRLAVTEATLRYRAPARYDDRIRVETYLTQVYSRGITFHYEVVAADTGLRLVSVQTQLTAIDLEGRVTRLPSSLREQLAGAVEVAP
jgi:acyl-CoA thioester hydrolase